LNAGGGKAISFSIVQVGSCSSVSVAHPSYLPIRENRYRKKTYCVKGIAESNAETTSQDGNKNVDQVSGIKEAHLAAGRKKQRQNRGRGSVLAYSCRQNKVHPYNAERRVPYQRRIALWV
jgi:hypothetical protein